MGEAFLFYGIYTIIGVAGLITWRIRAVHAAAVKKAVAAQAKAKTMDQGEFIAVRVVSESRTAGHRMEILLIPARDHATLGLGIIYTFCNTPVVLNGHYRAQFDRNLPPWQSVGRFQGAVYREKVVEYLDLVPIAS